MTTTEVIIDEVRESRRRMSRDCGHDPAKLIAYLKHYNSKHSSQVLEYKNAHAARQTQPV